MSTAAAATARRAAAAAAGARVIDRERQGLWPRLRRGRRGGGAECGIIVFMDGDGADRGDLIAQLVDPIRRGEYDFVIASRTRGEREAGSMSWLQLLAGYLAGLGIGRSMACATRDMCAYRAIRRDCLERLRMREMTYGWNIEMQMRAARAALAHSRSADALSSPQRRQIQGRRLAARVAAGGLSGSR